MSEMSEEQVRLLEAMQIFAVFRKRRIPPLKLGIHKDMIERGLPQGVSRSGVQRFLARICTRNRYMQAMRRGGSRFDLDGVPCGIVSLKEQKDALRGGRRRSKRGAAKVVKMS